MRALWLAVVVAGCAPRAAEPGMVAPPSTPRGMPFAVWREADVVVVMPLGALGGAWTIEDEAGVRGLDGRGGREAVIGERVVVTWRGAAAGARVVLDARVAPVTAPEWVPIVPRRVDHAGPAIDKAVRIR